MNFDAAALTATADNNEEIILLSESTISITFTSPFVLSRATDQSLLALEINVPSDLTPIADSCELSISGAVCAL